jgi:hypothetical protein
MKDELYILESGDKFKVGEVLKRHGKRTVLGHQFKPYHFEKSKPINCSQCNKVVISTDSCECAGIRKIFLPPYQ